jgi:hypothetical protein
VLIGNLRHLPLPIRFDVGVQCFGKRVVAQHRVMLFALIATLTYSIARITAALKIKVEDLRPPGPGSSIRLQSERLAMVTHRAIRGYPSAQPTYNIQLLRPKHLYLNRGTEIAVF